MTWGRPAAARPTSWFRLLSIAAFTLGLLPLVASAASADANTAPALVSISVVDHSVSPNVGPTISWELVPTLGSGSVGFDISLVRENQTAVVTLSQPLQPDSSGLLVAPAISQTGIWYAQSVRVFDSAGNSRTYNIEAATQIVEGGITHYGAIDRELLGDVWLANATAVPSVPAAPTLVDALGGEGPLEVSVLCQEASSFGLPIIDYVMTATPVADGAPVTQTYVGWRCSHVFTGLTAGTTYSFSVVARTGVGSSTASNSETATPPDPVPAAATVTADRDQPDQVAVSWTPSETPNDPATVYELRMTGAGAISTSATTDTATRVTDLSPTESYSFAVRTRNSVGWSDWSQEAQISPWPNFTPPSQVGSAQAFGHVGWARVEWSAAVPGDLPLDRYRVIVLPGREAATSPYQGSGGHDTTEQSLRVDQRVVAGDYTITVFALDTSGSYGPGTSLTLKGTATTADPLSAALTSDQSVTVTGAVTKTRFGRPAAGVTVTVQRRPTVGGAAFDPIRVQAVTDRHGQYVVTFVPRAGYDYRVALTKQPGLAGSATDAWTVVAARTLRVG